MVNWNWNQRLGVIAIKDAFDGRKVKVNLYVGNCLGVMINEWYNKEEKKKQWQFVGYWNDETHLKNLLGLTKEYKGSNYYKDDQEVAEIRLNTYYADAIKIAKLFARVNIKTILYYQEPKNKGVK